MMGTGARGPVEDGLTELSKGWHSRGRDGETSDTHTGFLVPPKSTPPLLGPDPIIFGTLEGKSGWRNRAKRLRDHPLDFFLCALSYATAYLPSLVSGRSKSQEEGVRV